jgi:hypothetical protein
MTGKYGQGRSGMYAYSGNAYAAMANGARPYRFPGAQVVTREEFMRRAVSCWNAAIARGFVCC